MTSVISQEASPWWTATQVPGWWRPRRPPQPPTRSDTLTGWTRAARSTRGRGTWRPTCGRTSTWWNRRRGSPWFCRARSVELLSEERWGDPRRRIQRFIAFRCSGVANITWGVEYIPHQQCFFCDWLVLEGQRSLKAHCALEEHWCVQILRKGQRCHCHPVCVHASADGQAALTFLWPLIVTTSFILE